MTVWLIDTLRRIAIYLENRHKPALDLSSFVAKEQFNAQAAEWAKALADLQAELKKQRTELQNLSLLVGLNRSIPTVGGRK